MVYIDDSAEMRIDVDRDRMQGIRQIYLIIFSKVTDHVFANSADISK